MSKKIIILISAIFLIFILSYLTRWDLVGLEGDPMMDSSIPDSVKAILQRSCYDCHSSQTQIPGYGKIFPVTLYLQDHVREGRESLDFGKWDSFSARKKATESFNMMEEIDYESMPPSSYLLLHQNAKLSEEDIQALWNWQDSLERIYSETREEDWSDD